jgi:anti-sigma regulatory factor (Ser/Thr protein kinase)
MSGQKSSRDGQMREAELALPAAPSSVPEARRFVGTTLAGTPADGLSGDARLLVSELVTNVLLHARSPLQVLVRLSESIVRVEVRDGLPRMPVLLPIGEDGMAGRGLQIVDQLADGWGAEPRDDGKIVWFELSYAS